MPVKVLVLDANILIRAILGHRVRALIEEYCDQVSFLVPHAAYAEAEENLSALVVRRGGDPATALAMLRALAALTELVAPDAYREFESMARERLGQRDRTTGRSSLRHWLSVARSGLRIPISSDAAWPHGRRAELQSSCETDSVCSGSWYPHARSPFT